MDVGFVEVGVAWLVTLSKRPLFHRVAELIAIEQLRRGGAWRSYSRAEA